VVVCRDMPDQLSPSWRNLVTTTFDPSAHAEIVALREAGRALQRVDFSGCVLYTTFEPCPMCCGAILASGISILVMGGRPTPVERRWGELPLSASSSWQSVATAFRW
jgi:tRNA(adenine34) deaminase